MPDRLGSVQERSNLRSTELLAIAGATAERPIFYWEKPAEDLSLLAIGVAWEVRASGAKRFDTASRAAIEALARLSQLTVPSFGPLVLGGFGFSDRDCLEPEWRELPSAWLWIPELLWVRRGDECWLTRTWRDGARSRGHSIRRDAGAPARQRAAGDQQRS